MNDPTTLLSAEGGTALLAAEVTQSLARLKASPEFAKAPRMCKLLAFLVETKLSGQQQITEYEIGLAVFRRDAKVYNTALDPVVRVQVGRLRARLKAYYAGLATPPAVQVSIPLGAYIPVFSRSCAVTPSFRYKLLQVAPLRNLSGEHATNTFVSGLDEELGSRLFHAFGSAIELREESGGRRPDGEPPHRLEGSIRVEEKHVRASMRVVDTNAGQIAWLSKFDFRGNLCMSLQEKLASAICDELERFLAY